MACPHTYEAVRATADELPGVVAQLRDGAYDGLNVTVPHKERVLSLVDALDESARVAGAANTLVRANGGRLVAHNTDAPALAAELAALAGSAAWPAARCALVLGSGGAARAAVAALGVHLGVRDIAVRARAFADVARREAFVRTAACPVTPEPWAASSERESAHDRDRAGDERRDARRGRRGRRGGRRRVGRARHGRRRDRRRLRARETRPGSGAARRRGLRCDDGLGMLARQGALALELWLADWA